MKYGLMTHIWLWTEKRTDCIFTEGSQRSAGSTLKPGGWLVYEIGWDQGQAVTGIMENAGFEQVTVKKDLAGLDRVVLGQNPRTKIFA